jgi:hypothetical protein
MTGDWPTYVLVGEAMHADMYPSASSGPAEPHGPFDS